ncbi:MAG: MlaD family protein [Allosphingosinicella sp.]
METRSNRIFVGIVVALALAALVAFALWLTASSRSTGREYDVVLDRSVSGLLVGSPVTFSGVRVGRVMAIDLDRGEPGRIRVRIAIDKPVPITEGTVAHLEGDLLFGTALITLEQNEPNQTPLVARGEGTVPVIPVEKSGLAALASDPTPMVESIAAATDRLMEVTTPEERRRITAELDALARSTGEMARQAPELRARIAAARAAIRDGGAAANGWAAKAAATRRDLDARSAAQSRTLRAQLAEAREATGALDARIEGARTGIQTTGASAAELQRKIEDARLAVREVSASIKEIDRGGAGGLSGPPTPDYKPKER